MQCRKYDPIRADKLVRNDWYRMRRYLEIALSLRDAELAEGGPAFAEDGGVVSTFLTIHTHVSREILLSLYGIVNQILLNPCHEEKG
jgi:hypothetical protein